MSERPVSDLTCQIHAFEQAPADAPDRLAAFLDQMGLGDGQLHALLDAAACPNIAERSEADGLLARCLWQGKQADSYGNHGPWLIRLAPGARLTRDLFSGGDPEAPFWQLWGRWPGLLIRARQDTDHLLHHLRKYTRLRDDAGTWFYFRFWEPRSADAFWSAYPEDQREIAWRYGDAVASVAYPQAEGLQQVTCTAPVPPAAPHSEVPPLYRPLFRQVRWRQFQARIHGALQSEGPPYSNVGRADADGLCEAFRSAGYRREAAIWDMVRAAVLCDHAGGDITRLCERTFRAQQPPDDLAAARAVLAEARRSYGDQANGARRLFP